MFGILKDDPCSHHTSANICFYIGPLASPDEVAFIIDASDPENDALTFELIGPNSSFFKVEQGTGRVFISQTLDREVCWLFYLSL